MNIKQHNCRDLWHKVALSNLQSPYFIRLVKAINCTVQKDHVIHLKAASSRRPATSSSQLPSASSASSGMSRQPCTFALATTLPSCTFDGVSDSWQSSSLRISTNHHEIDTHKYLKLILVRSFRILEYCQTLRDRPSRATCSWHPPWPPARRLGRPCSSASAYSRT